MRGIPNWFISAHTAGAIKFLSILHAIALKLNHKLVTFYASCNFVNDILVFAHLFEYRGVCPVAWQYFDKYILDKNNTLSEIVLHRSTPHSHTKGNSWSCFPVEIQSWQYAISVEAVVSPGLLCYDKNTQLAIITVEIKLGLLSFYTQENMYQYGKRPSCFGGNFTRGAMQHGKNLPGWI